MDGSRRLSPRPTVATQFVEHEPRPVSVEASAPRHLWFSIVASPSAAAAALLRLPTHPHVLTVASEPSSAVGRVHATLVVLDGDECVDLPSTIPWLAWNRTGTDAMALAAYRSGARAVLPADVEGSLLLATLERIAAGECASPVTGTKGRRSYPEGARIALGDDQVLCVESGVVAQRVIHADGTNVLIGLFGAGQIVVGHPDDSCCLDLSAHTDVEVRCQRWDEMAVAPGFALSLRVRLRRMEAWAAAQARPRLDERLLGVLAVLVEQFGRTYQRGVLVDVRLTHDQLASATAATRATVTRALGRLRRRRIVWAVGSGAGRRLCLDQLHAHGHEC